MCTADADCGPNGSCVLIEAGAMVIKEMHSLEHVHFDLACSESSHMACTDVECPAGEACVNLMWIDEAEKCYSDEPGFYAVMVKGVDGAHDGWFWASICSAATAVPGNPPIVGPSAVRNENFFHPLQLLIEHSNTRYPTGQRSTNLDGTIKEGSIVPPFYEFGLGVEECVNCHASGVTLSTFSDLRNILGNEIRYTYKETEVPESETACANDGFHSSRDPNTLLYGFPKPLAKPDPKFLKLFTQFTGSMPSIQNSWTPAFPPKRMITSGARRPYRRSTIGRSF